MGVSGSGKTTLAAFLAGRLGWDFLEGDAVHPPANIEKMASGHPLDDQDRSGWLDLIAAWIEEHTATGRPGIVTCSALKRKYRDTLRRPGVVFVYLTASKTQIAERIARRHGHFMPASLLDSQFADLEPPGPDENAITVDANRAVEEAGNEVIARLNLDGGHVPNL
jgi:carbohydrate kinase (thermoresistant glucokinase family)